MFKFLKKPLHLVVVTLSIVFFACSVEEETAGYSHSSEKGNLRTRMLRGGEALAIKKKLKLVITRSNGISLIGDTGNALRTPEDGIIDYSEIMEVIDSLGETNYTFKVRNHPEDSEIIFHNLVLHFGTEGEEGIHLMKYEKTNGSSDIREFEGYVTAKNISSATNCPEITYPPILGNNNGNNGGGTEIPVPIPIPIGTPNPGSPSNSGSGGNSISDQPELIFACNSCSFSSNSWAGYSHHTDGNGNLYPFTLVVFFPRSNYTATPVSPTSTNPCPTPGAVGLLPVDNFLDCVTAEKLAEVFPNASMVNLNRLSQTMQQYGPGFGIDTKEEVWHFLAQIGAETGGLTNLNVTENLNYQTPSVAVKTWSTRFTITNEPGKIHPGPYMNNPQGLANLAYCCKFGNGDENSGDGWTYRGRGIIQLTWHENYEGYQNYINANFPDIPYNSPNDVSNPNSIHCMLSGMWFFKAKILNRMQINANTSVTKVTSIVNPKLLKLQQRKNYFNLVKQKINC